MSCRQKIAVSVMSATLFLAPISLSTAETLIITVDGTELVGDVISAGVNTLTMKLNESGYKIVPVQSISRIQVDVANGAPIGGKFIDWSEGEMILRVGDRDVGVREGTITSVSEVGVAAGGPKLSAPEPATPEPVAVEPPAIERQPAPPEPAGIEDDMPANATM